MPLFRSTHLCPVCGYRGTLLEDLPSATGTRKWARCPCCGALERHRLQKLVMDRLSEEFDFGAMRMLHVAPEPFMAEIFRDWFASYETADLMAPGVDHQVDLCRLPFENASYDIVYASHVLEHIRDDLAALHEIARVLTPEGLAILPVPIVAEKTVEYRDANPNEHMHVRAPGPDYYDRYAVAFGQVRLLSSADFDDRYQTRVYEDRSGWPNEIAPERPAMRGKCHVDIVAVALAPEAQQAVGA